MNRAKLPTLQTNPPLKRLKQERVENFKKGGRNMLQKEAARRVEDERLHDHGAFYFLRKGDRRRLEVSMTSETREPWRVAEAAKVGCAVKRALKKRGVPGRIAGFHSRRLAWQHLKRPRECDAERPRIECIALPQHDRYDTEADDPRKELRELIESTLAKVKPSYKRSVEVVDGRLKQVGPEHYVNLISSAKAENDRKGLAEAKRKLEAITIQPKQPETIGEFIDRFPQHEQAVARLLRKINPERKEA